MEVAAVVMHGRAVAGLHAGGVGELVGADETAPANLLARDAELAGAARSEEHTSELQSLMRISYAVFCLKKKKRTLSHTITRIQRRPRANQAHTNHQSRL